MKPTVHLSRRNFLKAGVLAGSLVVGFHLVTRRQRAVGEALDAAPILAPNAFLRIDADGTITILAKHSEMGQGIHTSLAMCVAEELDADWTRVRVDSAPAAVAYHHTTNKTQITGGSSSTPESYLQMREAGAVARRLLVEAAAIRWETAPQALRTENSTVTALDGRTASYGELVGEASRLPIPDQVTLKDPSEFKLIGKGVRRLDSIEKVTGRAIFGLDVCVPGMLTAVVSRPPVFGAKVGQVDSSKAKRIPGVRDTVILSSGVAVVADCLLSALQGRDALTINWTDTDALDGDTHRQFETYTALLQSPGAVARETGNVEDALAQSAARVDADFEFPYLAHAAMEPLNAVAHVRPDGTVEIWAPTQYQTADQTNAARVAGVAPEMVSLHTTYLGGGFGRKSNPHSDFVVEAVAVSKAVRAPVKVVWTREDDMQGGYYRPRVLARASIGLDSGGQLVAWDTRIASQSILRGTSFEAYMNGGVDPTQVEGIADSEYAVPNARTTWHAAPDGVPVLWWRSVGHSTTAFMKETLVDDAARLARRDPVDYRIGLLAGHPRHAAVLKLLRDKSNWGHPPAGRFQGVAIHESFGTIVGEVAEISVSSRDEIRVHRVTAVVDCGSVVNPDTIRAQIMSAVLFGLSAALHGRITFAGGRVQQSNFHDYPILRFNEAPVVDTHIVESQAKMGGIGEPGTPPIAPAVANAVLAATGKRIRSLPLTPEKLRYAKG